MHIFLDEDRIILTAVKLPVRMAEDMVSQLTVLLIMVIGLPLP